jgi:hypothetical protein
MEVSQPGYTRASSLCRDIHLAFIRLARLYRLYRSRFVEAGARHQDGLVGNF